MPPDVNRPRMKPADLALKSRGTTRIEPGSSRLIHALRFLGYTFEQAAADIVDNSVGADAANVALKFITAAGELRSFIVADDGRGMDESRLNEAMRFGSQDDYDDQALGKYGLGLKLASLSHASTLEVLTRQKGVSAGRRWTVEGLSHDWQCEMLDPQRIDQVIETLHPDLKGKPSGTLIIWNDIDRLNLGEQGLEKGLEQLTQRLQTYLGLHFHRFIESGKVRMWIETRALDENEPPQRTPVTPINPFKTPQSGHPDYPRSFKVDIPDCGALTVRACIWPPNSKDIEYRLKGTAARRQGFYFYRRDRLIQAGGWNGVIEHESEPHSSLARLAIDLPPALDSHFGLSVQKSRVVTPPAFVSAVSTSRDGEGRPWLARYRHAAAQAYRHDDRAEKDYPLVPADGLPADLADRAREELVGGPRTKARTVRIEWSTLPGPDFFDIDRDALVIRLNKNYRSTILAGRRGTPADAPILKLLLFFMLEDDLNRDRMRADRKARLDAINRLLSEAVEHEDRR